MIGRFHLGLWVLVASAAAAVGMWKWLPGTSADRALFTTVAGGTANGTLFISGAGSHADPWKLRTFSADARPDFRQAPVIVSLGDDLAQFFQSAPPAPIDMAVILTNFNRLGARKAATAAVMAWEKPDPIGLAAFEKSLEKFDSLVMAAPLSRGVVASAMPAAFRRSSIPVTALHGDASLLPLVNRLPISGVILGGDETIAGFSVLESEAPTDHVPLMARWEDRVVFSFPLLTVMQRLDLPLDGMEVRLGEFLKLGPAGPIVPIEISGRLAQPLKVVSAYKEISAEALIDGGDDLFPKQAPDPVIVRNDQSAADPATREFSRLLSGTISAIASSGGLSDAREYRRLGDGWEAGILAAVIVALSVLCAATSFVRTIGALVLGCAGLAGQWIAFGMAGVWFPGMAMVAAVVMAVVVGKVFERFHRAMPEPEVVPVFTPPAMGREFPDAPEPESEPEPRRETESDENEAAPEVEPKPVVKKAATKKAAPRKTAAKKTAAKKVAAKKAAPKKTDAPPKAPRRKKPPTDG